MSTNRSYPVQTIAGLRPAVLVLAVAASACGTTGAPAASTAAGDTVFVGVAAAIGPATLPYFRGVEMAVDALNAQRPQGSPPFGVRYPLEDQPTQVDVAARFRDDPAVVGVVGHTGSGQMRETAPIYDDRDQGGRRALVAVSPTATNPVVTRESEWVFRVCPTDTDAARALARFAVDSLSARSSAIIFRNDLFGRGYRHEFRREFERAGGTVVEQDPYLAEHTEYEAYIARFVRSRPDAVVIAGGASDAADIIRLMRAYDLHPAVMGSDDVATLQTQPETASEFRGVRYTAFFDPQRTMGEQGAAFVRE
jgi:branched-chain amino acid transport system substrate-binding protein